MFAVSGVMQGSLLIMCIAWKFRQRSLGIDDFGRPLLSDDRFTSSPEPMDGLLIATEDVPVTVDTGVEEDTPLLSNGRKDQSRWW
jgi:hypothetical protein